MARQLGATKLNLAVGSDPFILPTVKAADLFLVDFPPGSNPKGQDKQAALALKDVRAVTNRRAIVGFTSPLAVRSSTLEGSQHVYDEE